jgi:hypothetical protein
MKFDPARLFEAQQATLGDYEENTDLPVTVDGTERVLRARAVKMISIGTPVVELCTSTSTPDIPVMAEGGIAGFIDHTEKLVRDGTTFCTCLRATWNLPMYEWSVAP